MREVNDVLFQKNGSEARTLRTHNVLMYDRKRAQISGVQDVEEFDSCEVILDTCGGRMKFQGNNLKVKRLNLEKGEVDVEGEIDAMFYLGLQGAAHGKSVLGKLFH